MKKTTCLLAVVATFVLNTGLTAGEINSDQLIEGFISFVFKAENPDADAKTKDKMRQELQRAKMNPLLAPYRFEGEKCDRATLVKAIQIGVRKWSEADLPLTKSARYASEPKNLENLSDSELVVAQRLVEQGVSQIPRTK